MPIIHRESPWLRNGADIYYNNGNVGIGTTGPGAKLDIAGGSILLDGSQALQWDSEGHQIYSTGLDGNHMYFAEWAGNFHFVDTNGNVARVTITGGNVGIGTTDQFAGSAGALALGNAATVPSSNPTDAIIMYSADIAAGQAAPHFRCEAGWVIKLYQQALIADPTGGATVDAEARTAINAILDLLVNNGLMAAA